MFFSCIDIIFDDNFSIIIDMDEPENIEQYEYEYFDIDFLDICIQQDKIKLNNKDKITIDDKNKNNNTVLNSNFILDENINNTEDLIKKVCIYIAKNSEDMIKNNNIQIIDEDKMEMEILNKHHNLDYHNYKKK